MNNTYSIKVLIVDDIETICRRIENILKKNENIKVVGTANNGYEAVIMTAIHQPDVILMDIDMEDSHAGLRASKEILEKFPDIKIVILTVHEEDQTVFSAFKLGITDYVLKNAKPSEIINAVKDAYFEQSPIRPVIAKKIRNEFVRAKTNEENLMNYINIISRLTPAETSVIKLFIKGMTRLEICNHRHIEISTLKTEINSILKKFNCRNINEVICKIKNMNLPDF
ncbi:response regulator transcription factor [Clostridium sp. SYSU_GA19001]|uniref:response regulator transcription factor n=1 Tax=Clostridium caldaquaticum TaxID=2940653 RepID=UPI0020777D04|nr:response regulator transcription factor [Clostridium caldaquaticum]MCM8711585.1 response regulator transcription factor [Clostridium caldaquaticum]